MLDLSNNNATGHNFKAAYVKGGQRRVYLKRAQGVHFTDTAYPTLRTAALKAGLTVGAYDFLEPLKSTPEQAAAYLLRLVKLPLVHGRDLRVALDCESGTSDPRVGAWIAHVARIVKERTGVAPLIYGSGYWLEACKFKTAPGPLWLAAYGRNDGREYPVGKLPAPWLKAAAHQFTSTAHVAGINGACDLSHVLVGASIDVPRNL